MATQTYTSAGAISIPTNIARDEGGTLSLGRVESGVNGAAINGVGIGATELDYMTGIRSDTQLWAEFQDWLALQCRATTNGLSNGTAALPYASVTPREVMFRLSLMLAAMLRDTHPYGM